MRPEDWGLGTVDGVHSSGSNSGARGHRPSSRRALGGAPVLVAAQPGCNHEIQPPEVAGMSKDRRHKDKDKDRRREPPARTRRQRDREREEAAEDREALRGERTA